MAGSRLYFELSRTLQQSDGFRTFSKAYGLAGLRCGYAVGALGLVRQLGKALLPYHVNAFTLMAAKTVYENKELYKERIKTIREERDKFADCLKTLGFKVWPTATNFVTFVRRGTDAAACQGLCGEI